MSDLRKFGAWLILAGLAGCATPAVVVVSPAYDPGQVKRVALAGFKDFPGASGSGDVVSDTFEKYLLWGGYNLVERKQVQDLLNEQSFQASGAVDPATIKRIGQILGVDALVFGSLGEYTASREQTVMVDEPQAQSDPIYGTIATTQRSGGSVVRTVSQVVTGYNYTQTEQVVPEVETQPAHVAMSVRLVSVETGAVLWEASADSDAVDLNAAAEQAAAKIMQGVVKQLKKGS